MHKLWEDSEKKENNLTPLCYKFFNTNYQNLCECSNEFWLYPLYAYCLNLSKLISAFLVLIDLSGLSNIFYFKMFTLNH